MSEEQFDEAELPPTSPRKKVSFSNDVYLDFIKNNIECCKNLCLQELLESYPEQLEEYGLVVGYYLLSGTSVSESTRAHKIYVLTQALLCKSLVESRNFQYRCPCAPQVELCLDAFATINFMKRSTCADLLKDGTDNGIFIRAHGLNGKASNHRFKNGEREYVKEVVINIANEHGYSLPKELLKSRLDPSLSITQERVWLPPYLSQSVLYDKYSKLALATNRDRVSRETFRLILVNELSFIKVSKHARGLCDLCFKLQNSVRTLHHARVVSALPEWQQHVSRAQVARKNYQRTKDLAQNARVEFEREGNLEQLKCATISFDFASSIHLPILGQQTTKAFYSTVFGYTVPIFGIVDEGWGVNGKQFNFFGFEGMRHDANAIASMLHLFFAEHCDRSIQTVPHLYINADSCVGQNKNQFILAYLMWRVKQRFHSTIDFHFMEVGHTKFRPDEGFGQLKRHIETQNVISMKDLIDQTAASTREAKSNVGIEFVPSQLKNFKVFAEAIKKFKGIRDVYGIRVSRGLERGSPVTVQFQTNPREDFGEPQDLLVKKFVKFTEIPTLEYDGLSATRVASLRKYLLAMKDYKLNVEQSTWLNNLCKWESKFTPKQANLVEELANLDVTDEVTMQDEAALENLQSMMDAFHLLESKRIQRVVETPFESPASPATRARANRSQQAPGDSKRANETPETQSKRRKYKCSTCQKEGHNSKKCPLK
jgi:hypothetical protein